MKFMKLFQRYLKLWILHFCPYFANKTFNFLSTSKFKLLRNLKKFPLELIMLQLNALDFEPSQGNQATLVLTHKTNEKST